MPVVDLSSVVTNAVPVGVYEVTLTGAKNKTNKNGNGEHLQLEFTISDDDHPELNGKKQWRNFSYGENALWALKNAFIAFDADPDMFSSKVDPEEAAKELFGNKAIIEVVENTSGVGPPLQVGAIRSLDFS